ncbi:dCTP deaminase [Bradyrhizobium sp. U531]|uniref:dCTP deaminase n=1 Tax=Bradyrhizobium sp. U531 TaxID=3053458 RepID=UPI003F42FEA1
MSALSGEELIRRLESKIFSERLVVSPILEPAEQLKSDRASVDVRLGFEFALISPSLVGAIDELELGTPLERHLELSKLYTRIYVPFGDKLVIHPHQFILAGTLEYLRLPPDLMSYVVGRSTWGRLGLTVATAIGIHPNFAGTLTLELRNLGETPLTLHPGDIIAQLFFHDVAPKQKTKKTRPEDPSQYVGTVDLIPRTISPRKTFERLKKLAEEAKLKRERA